MSAVFESVASHKSEGASNVEYRTRVLAFLYHGQARPHQQAA